ncbi:hypothetical protein ACFV19_33500 [Streptomyces griseoluteus]|uniref:hypothetical protein n=1 Tax=Streptomyces griseoluteus TaxID=29306 RepID=UPI0036C033A7
MTPGSNEAYTEFVQSTSVNRKLVSGTKLLVLLWPVRRPSRVPAGADTPTAAYPGGATGRRPAPRCSAADHPRVRGGDTSRSFVAPVGGGEPALQQAGRGQRERPGQIDTRRAPCA